MLSNYFKIAFRNLIKNKSHTFINIGGLTLGVVCALVIFLVIQFDLSFDTWHQDNDRIYRVVTEDSDYGTINYSEGGPYPRAEAIRNDITGVEYVTLVNNNFSNTPVLSAYEDGELLNRFKEEEIAFVDQDYFNIFTYTWIAGNQEKALVNPNTAVITKSLAERIFGTSDVIGRSIVAFVGSEVDLEITGLIKDSPKNSDFPFKLLASGHSTSRSGYSFKDSFEGWSTSASSLQNYVKLLPGVSPEEVNAQFDPMITKYRNEEMAEVIEYFLQPLSEIHFDDRFGNYNDRVIAQQTLFALGIIGLLLLLTACINFVNLNTAVAVSRSKEVGLRKTLGGTKTQLTFHFLGETAFVTLIAIILGIGLTEVLLPRLEPLLGFTPELSMLTNFSAQIFLTGLFLLVTLTAGWYPARYLSNFSPIEAIRNKINASFGRGLTLRRSLIVIQFSITQILIIGTMIIASQIKYFQNKDLGYDKDAIVEIQIPDDNKQTLETFKTQLLSNSSIINATFSNTGTTSNNTWSGNYKVIDDTVAHENNAQVKFIDESFVETYGLTILAGENLTPSDTVNKYLVNESFAKQVGYGDNYAGLIGKTNVFWGNEAPIVGVVKDFNTQSLHSNLEPTILTTRRSYYTGGIRISTNRTADAIAAIETAFTNSFPEFVFDYSFLDDNIAEMYETEQRTANIMNTFTVIAVLIGCLGLFGLVSYMATTKTKEIGVRKVLGANLLDILKIFAGELALLTGISFALAAPISWYLMQKWLSDFAYKIDLGIGIFAMALAGTLVIAALTISFKAMSAALANPVESLKSE